MEAILFGRYISYFSIAAEIQNTTFYVPLQLTNVLQGFSVCFQRAFE